MAEIRLRLGQNSSRRRGDAPALEVIKVMFCSREDVLVTRWMRRNSCGVTHKPPPLPHPSTPTAPDAARRWLWQVLGCDLALPLPTPLRARDGWRSISDACALRRKEAYGPTWFTHEHERLTSALPPSLPSSPPLANRKTRTYINFHTVLRIFRWLCRFAAGGQRQMKAFVAFIEKDGDHVFKVQLKGPFCRG